ncbi:hypothetical protein TSOC_008672 [Tetrabaena socialis]|uniref:DNA helicase n=1 Tax=Tetrabaena socialis TaxID=47790 RepID=A0A2J7ZXW6_9CHLO|nr:hypothetical protein TSOC_008672 [Tetrabaena socialis]|eukprot:PNH05109.1 hypothetical protein TSOC_008672 [Tetrabaena socialis]
MADHSETTELDGEEGEFEVGSLLSPEPDRGPRAPLGSPAEGSSLLRHLAHSGALDSVVLEAEDGQPRLREGALPLEVDVTRIMCLDPQLGAQLLQDPKGALWGLMDELHAEGLSASACPRLWLRPSQVPLPCQPVPALLAGLARYCSGPGQAQQLPVSCYGVVTAASGLGRRPHSRVLVCSHCGTAMEALDERGPPGQRQGQEAEQGWRQGQEQAGRCCNAAAAMQDLQEDLSGRVMVEVQDLWLAGMSSATPEGHSYYARLGCVRVTCVDDLAGLVTVGDVVRVVGTARLLGPSGSRTATPASTASAASGAATALRAAATTAEAHIEALSLLRVSPHSLQQLSLLLSCEPLDPLGPRLLQSMAALVSPHSARLASGLADDPLAPRLAQGARLDVEGQAGGVAHGSVLMVAGNAGVVVVEAELMSAKQKQQLCDLLGRSSIPLAPGRPEFVLPLNPTVWAVAYRQAGAEGGGGGGGQGARRTGRGAYGGGGGGAVPGSLRGSWSGLEDSRFDCVLEHAQGQDAAAAMALDAGSLDEGSSGAYLVDALQQHVAAAALLAPPPQLSDAALDLLTRYYVSVRQSGVQVTQAEVLRCLVKLATACARLHLRHQVLEAPDCVLAVLLMERTLACRFGDAYMGLGLPPLPEGAGLEDEGDDDDGDMGGGQGGADTVDAVLQTHCGTLARCLKGFT